MPFFLGVLSGFVRKYGFYGSFILNTHIMEMPFIQIIEILKFILLYKKSFLFRDELYVLTYLKNSNFYDIVILNVA